MSHPARTPAVALLCWRDLDHPQGGGSELYIQRVGAELARRGMRVTLLTAGFPGCDDETVVDGVRIVRRGGRLSVYPRAVGMLLGARIGVGPLRGFAPDVIVDTQNGVPFFASLVSRRTVVLVHHCHREQWPVAGPALSRLGWWIESRLSPWVHRRRRYVTVSRPSRAELVGLGVDGERISVVRAGIDPVPVVDSARTDGLVATVGAAPAPGPESAGPRIVVLSRLVPHKQIEHALDVLAALRDEVEDLSMDIVGGGWWDEQLKAYARELGAADRVVFHGHVSQQRKHELLAGARVHLMPSRKEGWGIAVVEAAQHGVPTVGYRASAGLTDSIDDGVTGLLVDGREELIAATRKLLENPGFAGQLGDAARDAATGYSWSATADGFTEVFAEVNPDVAW
ncbi:MAG TPA: glycosyltransferase family 4 protein [Gordonia sp. (in: high G+C Gram-positive bacteria)]|uniref:glycosyltransferase family 4 protein n=1 Tax=unclassified Gordonia (in: high G+C Gram-positive bacteria) TaxID=2657482 RepID=UPI000FBE83CA|nr:MULTISPECIES: glycosyltransferase family 4 protein [unclassified Gordonia (in: high G+C Gram-positive bacteria)]RUP40394.1 MAG: glycosyltransferase family 1 protein [Gordonia sp. (in: high G+C Gram-positive bacteria)]HNP57100.1 glycosyltransferase family 4 protein [Gordonia sp. (in: high G+C Gram-positive bacteria)]HRC49363.1 glycosyltransferase family 4 protein [Gordonia sp. (in: high G+C Gram-positive bacteria)]